MIIKVKVSEIKGKSTEKAYGKDALDKNVGKSFLSSGFINCVYQTKP